MKSVSLSISDFNPRSPRGGATNRFLLKYVPRMISIHAPHEGERLSAQRYLGHANAFQSTLPTRGSDAQPSAMTTISWTFQSTLPTRGSDDICRKEAAKDKKFQSTLPTRGSDAHKYYDGASPCEFQSTLPTRGSDCHIRRWIYQVLVSIHAPHEGERLQCQPA